jgi:cell wall-associated NlpC family hydrolase
VSKRFPALATRAAVVAAATAAAAVIGALPANAAPAAPTAPVALAVTPVANVTPAPAATALIAPAASARSTAVANAMSKIGAPYKWGATGPSAFDCSGLVSWAFKNAGISLPRTSRAQSQVGTPVSRANLQPGDLVFFYKPVSHVGIYIGGGKIVHASNKKSPVKVSDMSKMKFNSARRV